MRERIAHYEINGSKFGSAAASVEISASRPGKELGGLEFYENLFSGMRRALDRITLAHRPDAHVVIPHSDTEFESVPGPESGIVARLEVSVYPPLSPPASFKKDDEVMDKDGNRYTVKSVIEDLGFAEYELESVKSPYQRFLATSSELTQIIEC